MGSRQARVERCAAERAARTGPSVMAVPSRLAGLVARRRPPCPIFADCNRDHLKRRTVQR